MPVSDGYVDVECDRCGYVCEHIEMIPLAGGGYDTRNVKGRLTRDGWRVLGTETVCEECLGKEDFDAD